MKDTVPLSDLIEVSVNDGTKARVLRSGYKDTSVYLLSTYTSQGKRKSTKVLRRSIVIMSTTSLKSEQKAHC